MERHIITPTATHCTNGFPACKTPPKTKETPTSGSKTITSPIVGTFYRRPAPDKDPYVKVGDVINAGQIVCIVEAMKIMNEIESDFDGIVTEIKVDNGNPVEYNQILFTINPT